MISNFFKEIIRIIFSVKRHEVALFLSLRLCEIPCLVEIISLVCSFLPFDSSEKDYEVTDTLRSERGLEKADGNLYELHEAVHIETDIL